MVVAKFRCRFSIQAKSIHNPARKPDYAVAANQWLGVHGRQFGRRKS